MHADCFGERPFQDSNVMHWKLMAKNRRNYMVYLGSHWKPNLRLSLQQHEREDLTCSCYFCSFSVKGVKQIAFSLCHTFAVHPFGWRVLRLFLVVVKPYHKKAPICVFISWLYYNISPLHIFLFFSNV